MMKHAHNPDCIAVKIVEDAVAAIGKTSDRWIDFGAELARFGMTAQHIKGFVYPAKIGLRSFPPKLGDAELQN